MYRFAAGGHTDGDRTMYTLLGGKGANLAEMCRLNIPVPPGFTLSSKFCQAREDEAVRKAVAEGLAHIEHALGDGRQFSGAQKPLLLSVRSGAPVSMPGMMDTILNIGMSRARLELLAASAGGMRFALDAYRRLIHMFAVVVHHVPKAKLDEPLQDAKRAYVVENDADLSIAALGTVVDALEVLFERETGMPFPQDPLEQLYAAVEAVFQSWGTERARRYRRLYNLGTNADGTPMCTAATVQTMVFGNTGERSGTGVAFSRNPSTGARGLMGEWLANAQGEDVLGGIRTPHPLCGNAESFSVRMPQQYAELAQVAEQLEATYRDVQNLEFTVEEGRLFILQTRTAKRTARAALRTSMAMLEKGLINERAAVQRVSCAQLDRLLHPQIDPQLLASLQPLGHGLPASPGAARGTIVLDADAAEAAAKNGAQVILVRHETSPEDIHGMHAAQGIVTATGGATSHAAVVARGMGRPCVCAVENLRIDKEKKRVLFEGSEGVPDVWLSVGDEMSIDGASGRIYPGLLDTVASEYDEDCDRLLALADKLRHTRVRANVDTPEDAFRAVGLGAEGIGLCRTEYMFFAADRVAIMREMIVAKNDSDRQRALDRLEPMQRADFVGIFRAMAKKPVTVRLLDPPLHEFLPGEHDEAGFSSMASTMDIDVQELRGRVASLHESNPMLGHRGCRLGLTYPAIYRMQTRAIFDAAILVAADGIEVLPEIMVPLIFGPKELELCRADVDRVAARVFAAAGMRVEYRVGTMIELPRAALMAADIAKHADFFSFGTNDLTQTTLGISRDDAGRFLSSYQHQGIIPADPFVTLDQEGVGQLVTKGVEDGRAARADLVTGVCGEHGGDPASIEFFVRNKLDYVSCSPYRLRVARLALAQAAVRIEEEART